MDEGSWVENDSKSKSSGARKSSWGNWVEINWEKTLTKGALVQGIGITVQNPSQKA